MQRTGYVLYRALVFIAVTSFAGVVTEKQSFFNHSPEKQR